MGDIQNVFGHGGAENGVPMSGIVDHGSGRGRGKESGTGKTMGFSARFFRESDVGLGVHCIEETAISVPEICINDVSDVSMTDGTIMAMDCDTPPKAAHSQPLPELAQLALQQEDQDAVIISTLPNYPFCCHDDLLTMPRSKLVDVALLLNKRLPQVRGEACGNLRIPCGPEVSTAQIRHAIEVVVGIVPSVAPGAPKVERMRRSPVVGGDQFTPGAGGKPTTVFGEPTPKPSMAMDLDVPTIITPSRFLDVVQHVAESDLSLLPVSPTKGVASRRRNAVGGNGRRAVTAGRVGGMRMLDRLQAGAGVDEDGGDSEEMLMLKGPLPKRRRLLSVGNAYGGM